MKKIVLVFWVSILLFSCSEDDNLTESQIDTSQPELTELDMWIRENYTNPYNIEILYKWEESELELNRYLYPPEVENVQPAMEVVKKLWVDTYSEIGGENFIKLIAPRQLVVVGGFNVNPSGTITLGLAEGGKKITFFNTDFLDLNDRESLTRFIQTIQHEYLHILNQTVTYDQEAYLSITPENYTGQWYNESVADSRELGYITNYARLNEDEDIAEMVATMLTNSNSEWNDIINNISSETARQDIRTKEAFIVDYYETEFDIDLYALQDLIYQYTQEILNE